MFTIYSLDKLKNEFLDSLKSRYARANQKNKLSIFYKKNFIFYEKNLSYAGMETWLNSFDEKLFFEEALLVLNRLNSENDLIQFKEDLLFSIKNNFREEDFRFNIIEKSEFSKNILNHNILKIIRELDNILSHVNNDLISNINSDYYQKTNGKPSKLGLDTKLRYIKIPKSKIIQIREAENELSINWKYGYDLYKTLTKKIIIISSPDLVSYSHFTEFGISYINVIDRDLFETIDDLIHENSHHHLNLIIKKFKLLKNLNDNIVFYSPWRQSLRSTYAILHSVFTFSYGALLFENILNNPSSFMKNNLERVAFRFLEENLMLTYSLFDLQSVESNFYTKGKSILYELLKQNKNANLKINSVNKLIKSKVYKKRLSELENNLKIAIKIYR
jgi:hypothetical protein